MTLMTDQMKVDVTGQKWFLVPIPQKVCVSISCQSLWLHVSCVSSLSGEYSVCLHKLLYPGEVRIPRGVRTHVLESDEEWEWKFLHECCRICCVCSQEDTYSQPSLFFWLLIGWEEERWQVE